MQVIRSCLVLIKIGVISLVLLHWWRVKWAMIHWIIFAKTVEGLWDTSSLIILILTRLVLIIVHLWIRLLILIAMLLLLRITSMWPSMIQIRLWNTLFKHSLAKTLRLGGIEWILLGIWGWFITGVKVKLPGLVSHLLHHLQVLLSSLLDLFLAFLLKRV